MNIWRFLLDLWALARNPTTPRIRPIRRDGYWMTSKLNAFVGPDRSMSWRQLDRVYWTVTRKEFEAILAADWTDRKRYEKERYDCDNFAFAVKSEIAQAHGINSIGIVIDDSAQHAYNIVVFSDGEVVLFEPQTDKVVAPGSRNHDFKLGLILL